MSGYWYTLIIAICAAAQVPGMMLRGSVWSTTAFVFCLLIFIASVAINIRSRK